MLSVESERSVPTFSSSMRTHKTVHCVQSQPIEEAERTSVNQSQPSEEVERTSANQSLTSKDAVWTQGQQSPEAKSESVIVNMYKHPLLLALNPQVST